MLQAGRAYCFTYLWLIACLSVLQFEWRLNHTLVGKCHYTSQHLTNDKSTCNTRCNGTIINIKCKLLNSVSL